MEVPAFDKGTVEIRIADGCTTTADNTGRERLGAFEHLPEGPSLRESKKNNRGECVTGTNGIDDSNAGFGSCTHVLATCCQDLRAFATVGQYQSVQSMALYELQCSV